MDTSSQLTIAFMIGVFYDGCILEQQRNDKSKTKQKSKY